MSAKSDREKSAATQRHALSKATQGAKRGEGTAKHKKYLDCHVCGREHIVDGLTCRVTCIPNNTHIGITERYMEDMLS